MIAAGRTKPSVPADAAYFFFGVFLVELPNLLIGKMDPDAFLAKRLTMIATSVMCIDFLCT